MPESIRKDFEAMASSPAAPPLRTARSEAVPDPPRLSERLRLASSTSTIIAPTERRNVHADTKEVPDPPRLVERIRSSMSKKGAER
jgi:hypothetical protein